MAKKYFLTRQCGDFDIPIDKEILYLPITTFPQFVATHTTQMGILRKLIKGDKKYPPLEDDLRIEYLDPTDHLHKDRPKNYFILKNDENGGVFGIICLEPKTSINELLNTLRKHYGNDTISITFQ